MKKLIYSALTIVLVISIFAIRSEADPGDLFIVVELDDETACSVLKVNPAGRLSEFVTNDEILAVTGENEADCDNVGIACNLNGDVYFGEDFDDESKVLRAERFGDLSLFVPTSALIAATGDSSADLDKGMAFGPDGNLYAADEQSDSILQITVPGAAVSVSVTEEQIESATGETNADLEGGIDIDDAFNIYIADAASDSIVVCQPGGPCSVLTSEAQIIAALGFDPNLDEQILLVGNYLYVAEDDNCACVFRIDINTGIPEFFISEAQISSVTGATSDPEGGLAVDFAGRIYVGNSSNNQPSILRTGPGANVNLLSLFVSSDEILDLYGPDFNIVDFDAGMCIVQPKVSEIPTLSEWGLITMALVLGVIGFAYARRRKLLGV